VLRLTGATRRDRLLLALVGVDDDRERLGADRLTK
jgi:hypothetical protein